MRSKESLSFWYSSTDTMLGRLHRINQQGPSGRDNTLSGYRMQGLHSQLVQGLCKEYDIRAAAQVQHVGQIQITAVPHATAEVPAQAGDHADEPQHHSYAPLTLGRS